MKGIKPISKTKEMKKTISDPYFRKNCTKILKVYDEEEERFCYEIYFKPETVMNIYQDEWIDCTSATSEDLNGWLEEIAYPSNWEGYQA